MRLSRRQALRITIVAIIAGGGPLYAQESPGPNSNGIVEPSIATSLPYNGDPDGRRKQLYHDDGIFYHFICTNDVLGNLSGGNKRGFINQGKLEAQFTADLGKLFGLKDLTFYANGFQINDTGRIRRDYVGGINTIAAIEATPTTRLSELWIEQKFLGGSASFRIGQLAADSEFFFSDLSSFLYLQSDWPTIAARDLPSGGPAYPLATPGARLKVDYQTNSINSSFLFAIFNGDPAGPCAGEPDTCDPYGLNFRLQDPPFMIEEAQFRFNRDKKVTGLAATYKIGAWEHAGKFQNQANPNFMKVGDYWILPRDRSTALADARRWCR
jgi:porin